MKGAMKFVEKRLNEIYSQDDVGTTGHSFAAEAILLAEQCPTLYFIVKPAMYDLLCQPVFCMGEGDPRSTVNGRSPFAVTSKRLFQLVTARMVLQDKWQVICSPESCLRNFDAQPTNSCQCAELFPDEGLHTEPELKETEKAERRTRRQERMLSAWTRKLYSPPASDLPSSQDRNDAPSKAKTRKRRRTARVSGQATPSSNPKTIISYGNLDIILGLRLLSQEAWEDLECDACLNKRKKNWKRKEDSIWKDLDALFEIDADNDGVESEWQ